MKRVRFRDPGGSVREGTWEDDRVITAGHEFGHDEIDVLPPTDASKIVGVGGNHLSRYENEDREDEIPESIDPLLFVKTPNCLSGHGDTALLPIDDRPVKYEGEWGVIVGEQCKDVAREDAMDVVAGFTCIDDITVLREESVIRRKVLDNALPVGPVVVPPEEVPEDATMETRLNGEPVQRETLDRLVFSVPEIIEAVTALFTLEAGDVIAPGTPDYFGREEFEDGDTVEVAVEGVGTLRHHVRSA